MTNSLKTLVVLLSLGASIGVQGAGLGNGTLSPFGGGSSATLSAGQSNQVITIINNNAPTNSGITAGQAATQIAGTNSTIIQPNINSASNAVVIVPATNSLWVDFQMGNDSTGVRGSMNKKFATIRAAQGASSAGDTIHWTGILTALTNSIALTNVTLICDGGSITFSGHTDFRNSAGTVSIVGGTFTNVSFAVFNFTGNSPALTNLSIVGVTSFGGSDNAQINSFPAGGTCIVRNNYLGSIFDVCNIGGATTNFIGYVQGNTFFLTNAVAGSPFRAVGLGEGYIHVDGNTFTLINQGVTGCAAIYTGDPLAYGFIGGNTFMTNGSTVFTPYIDNLNYSTPSTNIYVFGHPFSEANVAGTVKFLGWDGSTLPNINGTNIQAATISIGAADTSWMPVTNAVATTNASKGSITARQTLLSTGGTNGNGALTFNVTNLLMGDLEYHVLTNAFTNVVVGEIGPLTNKDGFVFWIPIGTNQ